MLWMLQQKQNFKKEKITHPKLKQISEFPTYIKVNTKK